MLKLVQERRGCGTWSSASTRGDKTLRAEESQEVLRAYAARRRIPRGIVPLALLREFTVKRLKVWSIQAWDSEASRLSPQGKLGPQTDIGVSCAW